jgi:hypothetical protein
VNVRRRFIARLITAGVLAVVIGGCGRSAPGEDDPLDSAEVRILLDAARDHLVRVNDRSVVLDDPATFNRAAILAILYGATLGTVINEACPNGGGITTTVSGDVTSMEFVECTFEGPPQEDGSYRSVIDGEVQVRELAGAYLEEMQIEGEITATTLYTGGRHQTIHTLMNAYMGNTNMQDLYTFCPTLLHEYTGNHLDGTDYEYEVSFTELEYNVRPDADYTVTLDGQIGTHGTLPDGRTADDDLRFTTREDLHYSLGEDPALPYAGVCEITGADLPTLRLHFSVGAVSLRIDDGEDLVFTHDGFLDLISR